MQRVIKGKENGEEGKCLLFDLAEIYIGDISMDRIRATLGSFKNGTIEMQPVKNVIIARMKSVHLC